MGRGVEGEVVKWWMVSDAWVVNEWKDLVSNSYGIEIPWLSTELVWALHGTARHMGVMVIKIAMGSGWIIRMIYLS